MLAAELDAAFGTLRKTPSAESGTSSPTTLKSRMAAMGGAGKNTKTVKKANPKPSTSKDKPPKKTTNDKAAPSKKNADVKRCESSFKNTTSQCSKNTKQFLSASKKAVKILSSHKVDKKKEKNKS